MTMLIQVALAALKRSAALIQIVAAVSLTPARPLPSKAGKRSAEGCVGPKAIVAVAGDWDAVATHRWRKRIVCVVGSEWHLKQGACLPLCRSRFGKLRNGF